MVEICLNEVSHEGWACCSDEDGCVEGCPRAFITALVFDHNSSLEFEGGATARFRLREECEGE